MIFRSRRYLLIGFIVVAALAGTVAAQDEPCVGEIECYEPPSSGGAAEPEFSPEQRWSGLTDGRISPEMTEYYTILCQHGFVEVLHAVPQPTFAVDAFPVQLVSDLVDGGFFVRADSGLTIARSGDAITVSGDNGNTPGAGSKMFSLEECLLHNGGALPPPGLEEIDETEVVGEAPPPQDEEEVCDVLSSWIDFLYCLTSPGGLSVLMELSYVVCGGGTLPAIVLTPGAFALLRRRRKQRRKT